jgi:isocitrate/isopropylmalate dehydrogenase
MATHLALAMMLRHLGEAAAAAAVERAVEELLKSGRVPGVSTRSAVGTAAATDEVLGALETTMHVLPPGPHAS